MANKVRGVGFEPLKLRMVDSVGVRSGYVDVRR